MKPVRIIEYGVLKKDFIFYRLFNTDLQYIIHIIQSLRKARKTDENPITNGFDSMKWKEYKNRFDLPLKYTKFSFYIDFLPADDLLSASTLTSFLTIQHPNLFT